MNYSRKRLRSLARDVLKIAQENLHRHSCLQPVGLVYTNAGLSQVFQFRCRDLDEKRSSQAQFRQLLLELNAKAAIVVTESWLKMAPDQPLDLTKSVTDMPGRVESIVIEAASPKVRYMLMQVFTKDDAGRLHFEVPMEPDHPITWPVNGWMESGRKGGLNV